MASETLRLVQDFHVEGIAVVEQRRDVGGGPLPELVGRDFSIGSVLVRRVRLNTLSRYLPMQLKKPGIDLLGDACGLHCGILRSGVINTGNAVLPPAGTNCG